MKSTLLLSAATLMFSAAQAQVADTTSRNAGTTNQTTGTTQTMGTTGTNGSNLGATGTAQVGMDNSRRLNQYGSYSTRDSIAAKYKLLPMPGGLTIEKTFPILGTYQLNATPDAVGTTTDAAATNSYSSNTATSSTASTTTGTETSSANSMNATDARAAYGSQVTITLDSASKGIVWVDGLEQGRLKAYLKKSPATYRVVAQKSATGTAIPEGVMHLDTTTNTLHIALGVPYNDVDPTAVFMASDSTTEAVDNTAEVKVKTKDSKTKKTTKTKTKVVFLTATKVDAALQQQDASQQDPNAGATQQNNQQ